MTAYHIRGIPAPLVDHFWPFAEPFIKRALDHTTGEFTYRHVREWCKERAFQLWLVECDRRIIGAATTEVIEYPEAKHCRIVTLAGKDLDDWIDVADQVISAWAMEKGCDHLEALVRRGFVPKLQKINYKSKYCVALKRLPLFNADPEKTDKGVPT